MRLVTRISGEGLSAAFWCAMDVGGSSRWCSTNAHPSWGASPVAWICSCAQRPSIGA